VKSRVPSCPRFSFPRRTALATSVLFVVCGAVAAQNNSRPTTVSVLDFGSSRFAPIASATIRQIVGNIEGLTVLDAGLTRAAAKGAGYDGSLNMMVSEARDLGAALSSDFYMIGDAQTLRRSSSAIPIFFESYCSIFIISSRSGKLVLWDRLSADSSSPAQAEQQLIEQLKNRGLSNRFAEAIKKNQENERAVRAMINASVPMIEAAPDDEKVAEAEGLRLPRPFNRLRPEYPLSASKAEAEATVDVLVDVRADGEVDNVEVVRWAGFGLDEATIATVRKLHFFPAMKNGTAVPLRVLLRYHFRKPAPTQ
jgi:TonB family protein